jgi:hypothetical protein
MAVTMPAMAVIMPMLDLVAGAMVMGVPMLVPMLVIVGGMIVMLVHETAHSGQVRVDNRHKFFTGLRTRVIRTRSRVDHVLADVVFNDFSDETIQRATTRGRLLQDARALGVSAHGALNRFQLTL